MACIGAEQTEVLATSVHGGNVDPKFAGSNLTEAVGFFRAKKKKSSARLPSEGK